VLCGARQIIKNEKKIEGMRNGGFKCQFPQVHLLHIHLTTLCNNFSYTSTISGWLLK